LRPAGAPAFTTKPTLVVSTKFVLVSSELVWLRRRYGSLPEEIPRAESQTYHCPSLKELFMKMKDYKLDREFKIRVSFLEIYNE
jgi:hypothetical protein